MTAHCHHSLGQVLFASIFSRPVLLPVFYSRERQRRLSKFTQEKKTELVLQVVLLSGSFLIEQSSAVFMETRRLDGHSSGTPCTGAWGGSSALPRWGSEPAQIGEQTLEELQPSPAGSLFNGRSARACLAALY